jgi:glycolate oxidase
MYIEEALPPLFCEMLDEYCVKISFESRGLIAPENSTVVMIKTIGYWNGEAKKKLNKIFSAFQKENPIEMKVVEDPHEWEQIWSCREVIYPVLTQKKGPSIIGEIVPSLPLLKLPEAMAEVLELPKKMETIKNPEMYLYGHIGAPSLHPHFVIPKDLNNEERRKFVKEVRTKTEELNIKYGEAGGEWGMSYQRIEFIIKKYGKTYYDVLLGIKKILDPNNILNPKNIEV